MADSNTQSPPTYRIEKIWDLLKVPRDRRAECLRELAIGLDMAEDTVAAMDSIAKAVGADPTTLLGDYFDWIDDGLGNATLNLEVIEAPSRN